MGIRPMVPPRVERALVTPADNVMLAEPFDPGFATTSSALAAGYLFVSRARVTVAGLAGNALVYLAAAGTVVTGGYLSIHDAATNVLLGKTAVQTTGFQSTGLKTLALTAESGSSLFLSTNQEIYIGIMVASATVFPAPELRATVLALLNAGGGGKRTGYAGSGSYTTPPATLPALSASSGDQYWFGVSV